MTLPRSLKVCDGCGEIYEAEIAAETLHHESLIEHSPLLPPANYKRMRSKSPGPNVPDVPLCCRDDFAFAGATDDLHQHASPRAL